jgi:hypothetical protein
MCHRLKILMILNQAKVQTVSTSFLKYRLIFIKEGGKLFRYSTIPNKPVDRLTRIATAMPTINKMAFLFTIYLSDTKTT